MPTQRTAPDTPDEWVPVTFDTCAQLSGPFYHGTRAVLAIGDLIAVGHPTHFQMGRALHHVYFAANLEPAMWGAELSSALSGESGRGHIYLVEPTGPFEDDPNLTNKRFPGNPTRSYRTRDPLRIVGVVDSWEGHSPEAIRGMLDALERLRREGRYIIED